MMHLFERYEQHWKSGDGEHYTWRPSPLFCGADNIHDVYGILYNPQTISELISSDNICAVCLDTIDFLDILDQMEL